MISKFNPQHRKIATTIGLLLLWFLLLFSPIGHIVAVLTIVGWVVIFFMLGLMKVHRGPEK